MKDLVLIYRAYGSELESKDFSSVRPSFFSKFKCFKSMYDSFGGKADIYVIWDGKLNKLYDYIHSFKDIEVFDFPNLGNKGSLLQCYSLAEKLQHRYLYFMEDDTLNLPESAEIIFDGLQFGLCTSYQHLDRYRNPNSDITLNREHILLGNKCYWRTAESTVCTVAMSRHVFNEIVDNLYHFCHKGENSPDDRGLFRYIYQHKGIRLYSSLPAFSTHIDKNNMSPFVDWEAFSDSIVL